MRRLQSVGAQSFRSGFAFLVSLAFLSRFFQGLHEQRAVLRIFWFAFGGIAKSSGGRGEISGLQSEQAKIKRIIVLIGIKIGGATKLNLCLGSFATTGMGDREIVQNFRQVSP